MTEPDLLQILVLRGSSSASDAAQLATLITALHEPTEDWCVYCLRSG